MQLLHPMLCNVRIDLGCGEVAVTKKQLHDSKVSPMVQQMRSERMTQGVWGNFFVDLSRSRVGLDSVPECLSCHWLAAIAWKYGILVKVFLE